MYSMKPSEILSTPLYHHHSPGSSGLGIFIVSALFATLAIAYYLYRDNRGKGKPTKPDSYQVAAWIFALLFYGTTSLTYIPGLSDDVGNFAGIFKLDLIDDLLHYASALWATIAAWHSSLASKRYFQIFGSLYLADAIIGLFTQRGILDLGIWVYPFPNLDMATNFMANLPHLIIGVTAVYLGFFHKRGTR
jgi:hypothetical protein